MWHFILPALCVIAHLLVVIVFLPGFWRELDQRGFRWHDAFTLYVIPGLTITFICIRVFTHGGPAWFLVTAFLTVDAFLIVVVLTTVGLVARRRRAARVEPSG